MESKDFWMAVDTVREKAVDSAEKLTEVAGNAVDTVYGKAMGSAKGLTQAAEDAVGAVRGSLVNSVLSHQTPYQEYCESAEYLRNQLGELEPEVLLILGSGLGFLGEEVENPIYVNYGDIPHFKHSTAPGHKGRFVFGMLQGKAVAVMQGRMHTYEGYTMEEVSYAVRVASLLGISKMIVTNAAGAIRDEFQVGDIMLITDHIKLFAASPLTGRNIEEFGVRFPDMTHAYAPALQQIARSSAEELGIPLREGVYMYFPGPQFETPAEIRAARILGADVAGMSTVPEVITANHCGIQVLGFTLCANMAAGILDQPLAEEDVLRASEAACEPFSALVRACLAKM